MEELVYNPCFIDEETSIMGIGENNKPFPSRQGSQHTQTILLLRQLLERIENFSTENPF